MAHHRNRNRWLWLAFLVAFALALRSQLRGGTDLSIYLAAAAELGEAGTDLYRAREGIGPYPYPHFFLLPLAALQALLPETAIRVLWALGLAAATALLFAGLHSALRRLGRPMPAWRWAVLVFLFVRCISSNLTNGQLSLWVSALMLHGVLRAERHKDLAGGALLGAATALKLTPALLLLLLPAMGRLKAAAVGVATTVLLVFLLPWPVLGTEAHLAHLRDFHAAMVEPVFTGIRDPDVGAKMGPSASITGTLDYLLQPRPRNDEGRVLAIADLDDRTLGIVKALYTCVLLVLAGYGFWRARRLPATPRILLQAGLGMIAMVLLSPLSRPYHLSGILLPAALFCAYGPRRRDWLWWATAAAWALSTTLRQRWLLGRELWWVLDQVGLLHLGIVGLLLWLVIALHQDPKSSNAICSFSTPRS